VRFGAGPADGAMGSIAGLHGNCAGAAAIFLALALAGLVGMAGLGTEAASWYFTKRAMQGAADSGAATAAAAMAAGAPSSTYPVEAKSVVAGYNFVDGVHGTEVAVNSPPQSGEYSGNSIGVEVVISQPQTRLLSALFLSNEPRISVRAVALAMFSHSGQGCVEALDPTAAGGVTIAGSTALNFPGCSLYVNSSSSTALTLNGGATMNAASAYIVGGINGTGLTTSNGTYTGVNPVLDPYANVAVPAYSGCDQNNYNVNSGASETLQPGASGIYVFCNGLALTGGSSLTLGAGTYIIDRNNLSISGNSTLTATAGATIILTSSTNANCATAKIESNAHVSITAPTSGALAGVAFYQDRACTDSKSNSIAGGATQNIVGAIYFPSQSVNDSGGSPIGGAQCTQLVALTITFTGGSIFNNNCAGVGTRRLTTTGGRLVE
jgi:hypothetical protein